MSRVKDSPAAQRIAAGEWVSYQAIWNSTTCRKHLSFPEQEGVLTEGLKSDIVGGNLELEVSLRVAGATMLGQKTD